MKKSMYFNYTKGVSLEAKADAIAKAGFNGAELFRYIDDLEPLKNCFTAVKKAGLEVEAYHADFKNINDIWSEGEEGEERLAFLEQTVKEAGDLGIPVAVVHVSSGCMPPAYNERGLNRFQRLCQTASEAGVKIAFENLRKTAYLDYVLSAIPTAGFCFDCGHEKLYNEGKGVLEKYANRLLCMHLHDNNGLIDNHYLPFKGKINWQELSTRLREAEFKCSLCFEVFCPSSEYEAFPARVMEAAAHVEKLIIGG